MMFLRN